MADIIRNWPHTTAWATLIVLLVFVSLILSAVGH